jgi:hypothetical protein
VTRRFALQVADTKVVAQLLDEQAPGFADQFWNTLPLESFAIHAKFAGGEMIVMLPFHRDAENEVLDVRPGDIAYFPDMQTICVFYADVTPFGYVSVFARVVDGLPELQPVASYLMEKVSLPVRITRELDERGQ